jgi:hypothetical protein
LYPILYYIKYKFYYYDYNPYEDVKTLLVETPVAKIAANNYSLNYTEYLEELPIL